MNWEIGIDMYTLMCIKWITNKNLLYNREISSVLCDHLEGWDRESGREEDARGKRYGDIYICITDSLCHKAETYTSL